MSQLLVESIADYAIFMLDPGGRVLSWNLGAERLKGYLADEIIGEHFSRFYPDDDRAQGKPERELAEAVADGRVEDEGWRVRKDGTQFWANVVITALRTPDGTLQGFGKVTRDLTERKLAADALRESEARLALLVEVADYAIFMLDPGGRVLSWNLGAERLKGYLADEIIGEHFSRFYPDDDRAQGKPERELEIATAEGRVEDEGWRVRKDGSQFWANVVITALRTPDGTLQGFGKVTRDLTERKRAEDRLQALLQRERDAAERLRALDRARSEFVAMVAHDLASPLTVVKGFVDLLLSNWDGTPDAEKRDMLERAGRTAVSMSELVNDILEVGRVESGELQIECAPLDLLALLERAARDVERPDGPRRIQVNMPEQVPRAFGDERRLWQVIMNLLSNALKFSSAEQPVELVLSVEGSDLVVSVSDHGAGIAPADHERIFSRFVRLARPDGARVRGTGLGLYISRKLIEAQGGTLWVESELGRGATFRFTVPVAAEEGRQ